MELDEFTKGIILLVIVIFVLFFTPLKEKIGIWKWIVLGAFILLEFSLAMNKNK